MIYPIISVNIRLRRLSTVSTADDILTAHTLASHGRGSDNQSTQSRQSHR
jgi:hypothetical protein